MTGKGRSSFFISAGELSGDLIASDFVLKMKEQFPDLKPFGLAGDAMERAGVEVILHLKRFSMMGIADVIKNLGEIRIMEKLILQRIDERRPEFAVLVDFPGLHFRLAEQLKIRGIPVFQYVAPKVWAWGAGRVANLRRDFEMVLGVLPFESEFFKTHKVPYRFVGSPLLQRTTKIMVERKSLGFSDDRKLIALLPGSRISELKYILPKMMEIKNAIKGAQPDAQFVMPLASSLTPEQLRGCLSAGVCLREDESGQWLDDIRLVEGMSLEVMAVADSAVVASGTATLECALVGTPMVVVYMIDKTTYEVAKERVKVPWIGLVNLIAGREVVAEHVQDIAEEKVARQVIELSDKSTARARMLKEFDEIRASLSGDAAANAVSSVSSWLSKHGRL